MFGASAGRNGNEAGQMPLSNLRWAVPTTASHLQEQTVRELTDALATTGKPATSLAGHRFEWVTTY